MDAFASAIKRITDAHHENVQKLFDLQEKIEKLRELGFDAKDINSHSWNYYDNEVKDLRDFRKIHEVFGPLVHNYMEASWYTGDGPNTVIVTLKPKNEKFSGYVRFKYRKTLPENSKCKIVETTQTSRQVVCKA